MKKLGGYKCLQLENLHLRHLPLLGNFGQRYLWIDKSNGGLSCGPPRLIFSLCQHLFNYRKIEDDLASTVSVIYFVLNSWSTKQWDSEVCGGWEPTCRTPLPTGLYYNHYHYHYSFHSRVKSTMDLLPMYGSS